MTHFYGWIIATASDTIVVVGKKATARKRLAVIVKETQLRDSRS